MVPETHESLYLIPPRANVDASDSRRSDRGGTQGARAKKVIKGRFNKKALNLNFGRSKRRDNGHPGGNRYAKVRVMEVN
jgi:hypothetical protein